MNEREMKFKSKKGITLIALVVTIIVLLILAMVSISLIFGNNGIITKTISAKEKSEEAERMEELQFMLLNHTSNIETDDTIDKYLKTREGKEIKSSFKMDIDGSGKRKNVVEKDGYYYAIEKGKNGSYRIQKLTEEQIGEKIKILTEENFNGETTMEFDPGEKKKETLVFGDKIDKNYNFIIKSGEVTIYIDYDMTLTNEGMERSAIDIYPNAKLNLYIEEGVTLTVNSAYGKEGEQAEDYGAKGGPGGYAGIRVPWIDKDEDGIRDPGEQAELNLKGEGTVIAIGGKAGDGSGNISVSNGNAGGGGGRSELEPELVEAGGAGGDGNRGFNGGPEACGMDGMIGENCGLVNINGSVSVKAYGGAGGSSIQGSGRGSGCGGGGYPAARYWSEVGAGRWPEETMQVGAGGYSGGTGEGGVGSTKDGLSLEVGATFGNGGSYFEAGKITLATEMKIVYNMVCRF